MHDEIASESIIDNQIKLRRPVRMSSSYIPKLDQLIENVVDISVSAGAEILRYFRSDFGIENKSNNSPVTDADIAANDIIVSGLKELEPRLPIVSEEMKLPHFSNRSRWRHYWLIDPIDGTKAFIRGDDEFTVNIALIEGTAPVLGVVHCPVAQVTYWGVAGLGAYRIDEVQKTIEAIQVREFTENPVKLIVSKFRGNKKVQKYVETLKKQSIECQIFRLSSSYKFCRVAEGAIDLFPNFGVISEWDVAAGHCVVECAGGTMEDFNGNAIEYNKRNINVPPFLVYGSGDFSWRQYLPRY